MRCSVKYCQSVHQSRNINSRASFHKLPENEEERKIWLQRININPDAKKVRVCSFHFRPEDILKKRIRMKLRGFLRKGALPEPMPESDDKVKKCQICEATKDLLDTYSSLYNFLQKRLNEITYSKKSKVKMNNWLRFICTCCKEKVDDLWEFKIRYQNAYNKFVDDQKQSLKKMRIKKVYASQSSYVEAQVQPLKANEPMICEEMKEFQENSLKDPEAAQLRTVRFNSNDDEKLFDVKPEIIDSGYVLNDPERIAEGKCSGNLFPEENSQSFDIAPVVEETKISIVAIPPMIENFEPLKEHGYAMPYSSNSHPKDEVKQEIEEMEEIVTKYDFSPYQFASVSEANNQTNEIEPYTVIMNPSTSADSGNSEANNLASLKIKSKGINEITKDENPSWRNSLRVHQLSEKVPQQRYFVKQYTP
ncbi:uncharacterized protein LOC129806980 [Phlebotomus papatasi]|uniref:uncharacterized protein LOC129806980 n=1 Tax=Phlebotomus papatasi TaxID=29031 RepID=UPI0024839C46|nr:uncharacterized protein LOC129806980 [Phlebotomus papatasi]